MQSVSGDDEAVTLSRLVAQGALGEKCIIDLYATAPAGAKTSIVVALGESQGPAGAQLLQEIVRERSLSADRRCAAIVAGVKRMGADVSPLLKRCLSDRNDAVRRYALRGLAAVGDDSAWDEAYDQLRTTIDEQVPLPPFGMQWATLSLQSNVLPVVCYLGRHLDTALRRRRVVGLMRGKWSHLYTAEQKWCDQLWPEYNPASPDAQGPGPDPQALVEWVSRPVLDPVYPAN